MRNSYVPEFIAKTLLRNFGSLESKKSWADSLARIQILEPIIADPASCNTLKKALNGALESPGSIHCHSTRNIARECGLTNEQTSTITQRVALDAILIHQKSYSGQHLHPECLGQDQGKRQIVTIPLIN